MRNGVFEGANKPDFSDAKLLYHVKDKPSDKFNSAKPETSQAFRYVRYHAPKGKTTGYNVAEIKLYDSNGLLLKGIPLINPESADRLNDAGKVFDGDVTSFYESSHNSAWIGLDLGSPQAIGEIRYLPRSYDNLGIYEGHVYELFRWDIEQGWISLDTKEATAEPLQYQIPVDALLYLENKTLGKTGAVFAIYNGIQKFL